MRILLHLVWILDVSPYDSGSYASATTYATGNAVINACNELKKRIIRLGAEMLGVSPEEADFDGKKVYAGEKEVSLQEVAYKGTCGNTLEMQVTASYSSQISPPPYMVGAAEVEVDKETGNIDLIDYVAVVDCGTPINPNLARVQTEEELPRESVWHLWRMCSIPKKVRFVRILSCSTRSQAVRILEISGLSLRAAMKRAVLLVPSPSVSW